MSYNKHKIISENERRTLWTKAVLFFILPIIPVIFSLRDLRHRSSFVILSLYGTLIGYCFTLNESTGFDSLRYAEVFDNIQSTFFFDLASWISGDSNIHDFYLHSLSYLVSLYSSSYHYLFMAAAVVFSFFSLSTLKMVVGQNEYRPGQVCLCVVFMFLVTNSIININGFRFWTACWYVVWCTFNIILKNRKVHLLLLLISPFFHSSMFVYIAVFILYYFTRDKMKVWISLSIASIFVSSGSILLFQNISEYLPSALQSTINFYTDAQYIAERGSGTGWTWVENLFKTISMIYVAYCLYLVGNELNQRLLDDNQKKLYVFALCLLSFANFTSSIPSLGGRYIVMVYPFVSYFLIKFSQDLRFAKLCKLIPFVLSFQTLLLFRDMYLQLLPSNFFISSLFFLI